MKKILSNMGNIQSGNNKSTQRVQKKMKNLQMTSDLARKKSMIALDQSAVEDPLLDFYQMGGAVLIDNQEGALLYIHQSEAIDDLPSVDILLETINRTKGNGRLHLDRSVKKVVLNKGCTSRSCTIL